MRTTMKKSILASLLLSTALLASGSAYAAPLYFPHIATSIHWQTEIAIINTSDQTVIGTLRGLSDEGQLIDTKAVRLSAHGRRQINVADEFTNHTNIGYIIFDTDSAAVQGYTKFYIDGAYRVAIPAVKEVNTTDIYISHIASNAEWRTGVSLVNTTSVTKVLTINFDNGQSRQITLNANQHWARTIEELFDNQIQPGIESAVITNASGIIGLELFVRAGGGNQLEGILLTDKTALTIYYPHVGDAGWGTGIVAYNPSELTCTITIRPYSEQGNPLPLKTLDLPGKKKYSNVVSALGLHAQTAWFRIDSTQRLTGFELFGTADNNQLAAYAEVGGTGAMAGVFPKIEQNGGSTGIAFVNTEEGTASVTLIAYKDNGNAVGTPRVLTVHGHAKVADLAENLFIGQDIGTATYIAYSSDRNVVGFQLNGSADGMMLDGLPGLAGNGNGGGLANVATTWNAGSPPDLLGYKPFPAGSEWYRNVSADPVDPDSDNIIADLIRDDPGTMLHPDFGNSLFEGAYVGHPYDVVSPSATPMVHVAIGPDGYANESDPGPDNAANRVPIPVPIPADVHVEGGFDHHIYILDKEGYWLYELYHSVQLPGGSWQADQVTLWDLNDNTRRPWTWTSADQAGLSIFAGLVKCDEVQAALPGNGDIGHAIRFTVMPTQEPFIPPATHPGGGNDGTIHSPMMGQRFRLKASWLAAHVAEFSPPCQVILRTLARYGMILADTGSNLFIQGTRDARWVEDADLGGVAQLLQVPPSAFEVLAHSVEYTWSSHPEGPAPSIASLTATPNHVSSGGMATLNWSVTGASTLIISPNVGPVRGTSVVVRPTDTTTYTLYATNEFGRSHASVTVNVP